MSATTNKATAKAGKWSKSEVASMVNDLVLFLRQARGTVEQIDAALAGGAGVRYAIECARDHAARRRSTVEGDRARVEAIAAEVHTSPYHVAQHADRLAWYRRELEKTERAIRMYDRRAERLAAGDAPAELFRRP